MTSTKINIQENTSDKALWRKLNSVNTESDLDKGGGGKGFSEEVMFKLESTWQKKQNKTKLEYEHSGLSNGKFIPWNRYEIEVQKEENELSMMREFPLREKQRHEVEEWGWRDRYSVDYLRT